MKIESLGENILSSAVYSLVTIAFFIIPNYLPVLGTFLNLFTPLPVIIAYLSEDYRRGLIVTLLSTMGIFAIAGFRPSMAYIAEFGLIGLVIPECMKRKYSFIALLTISLMVSVVASSLLLMTISGNAFPLLFNMPVRHFEYNINELIGLYNRIGISQQQADYIKDYSATIIHFIKKISPAIVLIGSTILIFINYLLARHILTKKAPDKQSYRPFSEELFSEYFVWVFILSGILVLVKYPPVNRIGVNLLFVSIAFYFIHGISIVSFFSKKWKIPTSIKIITLIMVIIQPLLMFIIAGLGLFDTWFDFRKIKKSQLLA